MANTAQAAPRDHVAEIARQKAVEAVELRLSQGLELPRLLADTTRERERLLFRLRGLRSAHEKRADEQKRMSERGTVNAPPSWSREHAKAERQLVHVEAVLDVLREKTEGAAKERHEGHLLAAMQNAEAEEKRLLAVFRQEEAEEARKAEHVRFLAWKENLGL
jgi:hypothetical protein